MKEEIIRKYVVDMQGILKEVKKIGDYFLAWKSFPNEKMVIFLLVAYASTSFSKVYS